MNPEPEEFRDLRRLLALKRHEQPPPGYFERFSGMVLARIRTGERAEDSLWEHFGFSIPWLERLWANLESKPALAGAFGLGVCGLLVAGLAFSEPAESSALAVLPFGLEQHSLLTPAENPTPDSVLDRAPVAEFSSTEGAAPDQLRASLFRHGAIQQKFWFEDAADPAVFIRPVH